MKLGLERPVIADGRMQPHEWLLTADGHMLKTDSGSHGDDHFFPGPTDIAWDLAGAIVEWEMTAEQSATLLDVYRHKSGDDAVSRIQHFVIAYPVFRCAYCLMATNALGEGEESRRFRQAAEKYKLMIHVPSLLIPSRAREPYLHHCCQCFKNVKLQAMDWFWSAAAPGCGCLFFVFLIPKAPNLLTFPRSAIRCKAGGTSKWIRWYRGS